MVKSSTNPFTETFTF